MAEPEKPSGSTPATPAPGVTSEPGVPVEVNTLALEHEPVPSEAVTAGSPATGLHELGSFAGLELGVWEMTEGGMRDVEADEVFLVTAGRASVDIAAGDDGPARSVQLGPGTLLRLSAGMRTVWLVHDPLRKVYLALPE